MIIEDDEDIGKILESELGKEGYEVTRAVTGTEGRLSLSGDPDLILMDLMLPGMNGEELLAHIDKTIPVIAVSARSSTDDKVQLLEGGCVDYITKPFDIKELRARVAVALRMSNKQGKKEMLTVQDITLNTSEHTVSINDTPLHLTRTEYAILKILMQSPGRVISKSELLELVKKDTPDCVESSLKVHISNLRKKLKAEGGRDYIEAVWGIGFKIS